MNNFIELEHVSFPLSIDKLKKANAWYQNLSTKDKKKVKPKLVTYADLIQAWEQKK